MEVEADIPHHWQALQPLGAEHDLAAQGHVGGGQGFWCFAADDGPHQSLSRQRLAFELEHPAPVAERRHPVAEIENFVEAVRYIEHGDPIRREIAYDLEQALGFRL